MRSHCASRYDLTEGRSDEWRWPKDETAPTKYWLASIPDDIAFNRLIDLTKLRWSIERDYQELKQERSGIMKDEGGEAFIITLRYFLQSRPTDSWFPSGR
jgi:SRSO17 transposase